jgi:hypothetical protein
MSTRMISKKPAGGKKPRTSTKKNRAKQSGVLSIRSAPVSKSVRIASRRPQLHSSPNGNTTIHHRELVADLYQPTGSTAWQLLNGGQGWPINIGNEDLFPWASGVALRFESYRFRKLKFIFEPLVSTSTNGTIEMAVDYDAADAAPGLKATMSSYVPFKRVSIWDRIEMSCENADVNKLPQRFILGTQPPAGTDIRLWNVGNLYLAVSGSSLGSGSMAGELWVEYECELMTPQLLPSGTGSLASTVSGRNPTTHSVYGSVSTPGVTSTIQQVPGVNNQFFVTQPGRYFVELAQVFSGLANPGTITAAITPLGAAAANTWTAQSSAYILGAGSYENIFTGFLNVARGGSAYPFLLDLAVAGAGNLVSNFIRLAEYPVGA